MVCERDIAGAQVLSAVRCAGQTDRVVRTAEGTLTEELVCIGLEAADAIDLGEFEPFSCPRLQNRGDPLGDYGFSGAGWADEEHIVHAGDAI